MSSGTVLAGVWEEVECNQVRREDVLDVKTAWTWPCNREVVKRKRRGGMNELTEKEKKMDIDRHGL